MSDTGREARGAGRGVRDARRDIRDASFDDAIDGAVREMLDVEPPAGLRGRVLDQIHALSTSSVLSSNSVLSTNSVVSAFRRKPRKVWWLAAPVAAAAVIVLAVLAPWRQTAWRQTAWRQTGPSASPSIAQVQPAPVAPPVTPHDPQPPRTALNRAPAVTPAVAQSGPRPSPRGIEDRLVAAAVAPDVAGNTVIDPLAPIAPIAVAGTHPADIAPKEIAISPLAPIAELQIAPLSPPDRRN
jgi:hypothetical protein